MNRIQVILGKAKPAKGLLGDAPADDEGSEPDEGEGSDYALMGQALREALAAKDDEAIGRAICAAVKSTGKDES